MKYWAGVVLLALGSGLILAGLAHRRRARAEAAAGVPEPEPLHGSLAILADVVPPFVIVALTLFAGKISLAYVVLDNGRYFSVFDLGGLLFFLVGYGTWLVLKTKHRRRDAAVPAAPRPNPPPSPPLNSETNGEAVRLRP